MLSLKKRILIVLFVVTLEFYYSLNFDGIFDVINASGVNLFLFTFEDIFLRIPALSLIFIFAIHGRNALNLLPYKDVSSKRFFTYLFFHTLFISFFFSLAHFLYIRKENFVVYFLVLGFISLSIASICLMMTFFHFRKNEFLQLTTQIWKPTVMCIFFTVLYKFFLFSYENTESQVAIFAWPAKVLIFESINWLLNLYTDQVIYDFNDFKLGTESFSVLLKAGCSGIQGVNLFILITLLFYFLEKKNFTISTKKYLIFILLGAFTSFILNIIRIFLLIIIGDFGYSDWALGSFHSHMGIMMSLLLIILFCGCINHFYSKTQITHSLKSFVYSNPVSPYILPFLFVLISSIFFKALTPSWDIWYPIKVIIMAYSLSLFWKDYKEVITIHLKVLPILIGIFISIIWFLLPFSNDGKNFGSTGAIFVISWIFFKVIGSCLLIPIIEELAFRGFFLRFFIKIDFNTVQLGSFTFFSFLLTSLIFGVLHQHILGGIISGALLNLSIYYRKSLFDAILSHIVANVIIAFIVITFGRWEYWL